MNSSEIFYRNQIDEKLENSNKLDNRIKRVSILRMILVLLEIGIGCVAYKNENSTLFFLSLGIFIGLFIILVFYHDELYRKKIRNDIIIEINKEGIDRINCNFKNIKDKGEEFLDGNHAYVDDLDVFGENSLFQFMNSTISKGGKILLAKILKREVKFDKKNIIERQQAVKELSEKILWRQNICAEGRLQKSYDIDIKRFIDWGTEKKLYKSKLRVILACIFVSITWISILMCIKKILPSSFIILLFAINYLVVNILNSPMKEEAQFLESIKENILIYEKILTMIESENFKAQLLVDLQLKLKSKDIICSNKMKKLNNILVWLGDSSKNMAYILLNILFFSDIYIMEILNKWRKQNGKYLKQWIEVLNEIDALNSIANLSFEHPLWVYPQICDTESIECIKIFHPLIGDRAVKNDFSIKGKEKVALITGSNMSGKSTFLRTIGINLLLAYIGAPVSAEKLSCGIMNIYTCMRTKDSLEENISSFYAEILRIKLLVEACRNGEKVFFLLDEIFKGTNSKDRHVGATILIKQLIKYRGIGLVSTHDLELCDLENDIIKNYNFREFYVEGKIKFDYLLRNGKSTTQNAIHLMKLAGIEI
ncbi:MAG: DNA mismatch repair protein MutS [Clostridium butyricum]|nr:DNA mismatch repair protein MutS [Clostridium butyricum]